jgi:hypothetical protein
MAERIFTACSAGKKKKKRKVVLKEAAAWAGSCVAEAARTSDGGCAVLISK